MGSERHTQRDSDVPFSVWETQWAHGHSENLQGEKHADWLCWQWDVDLEAARSSLHPKKIVWVAVAGIFMISLIWVMRAREPESIFHRSCPRGLTWSQSQSQLPKGWAREKWIPAVQERRGDRRWVLAQTPWEPMRITHPPVKGRELQHLDTSNNFPRPLTSSYLLVLQPQSSQKLVSRTNEAKKGPGLRVRRWGDHAPFHQWLVSLGEARRLALLRAAILTTYPGLHLVNWNAWEALLPKTTQKNHGVCLIFSHRIRARTNPSMILPLHLTSPAHSEYLYMRIEKPDYPFPLRRGGLAPPSLHTFLPAKYSFLCKFFLLKNLL